MATRARAAQDVRPHHGDRSAAKAARADADGKPGDSKADSKARRYDPAETRGRVLEAAYMLFGTRGYAATGTADIAAQADVSEGSIFYHFGSKHGLLVELGRLHGQKMTEVMAGGDPLDRLSFKVTLNRCFDFCEVNNLWEEVVGDAWTPSPKALKKSADAEPFFNATRDHVVGWTKAHLDAVAAAHGPRVLDTGLAASLIFALVGEALHHYSDPGATAEDRARIRAECVRFCTAAAGHPALD